MSDPQVQPLSEIKIDETNLYREEVFTDLRVGSIKQLTPVTRDGNRDLARPLVFVGETQLMSQVGPLPVQTRIEAENLEAAIEGEGMARAQQLKQSVRAGNRRVPAKPAWNE